MADTMILFQVSVPGTSCNFMKSEAAGQLAIAPINNMKVMTCLSFFDKASIRNRTVLATKTSDGTPQ